MWHEYSCLAKLLGFDGITVETIVKSYWQNLRKLKLYLSLIKSLLKYRVSTSKKGLMLRVVCENV